MTIDISRGEQRLFHCALPGTAADNDEWIERKNRVVRRFGHSSYYMGVQEGDAFAATFLLDEREFAAHGGAFPLIVRDVGVVGTVTVSGLPQEEDHRFVVGVLRAFLALASSTASPTPAASIATSHGVPWRPSTNDWWYSSLAA